MKDQMLKIAGVKTEKEFYKKFPTEEAFMKKHGKAFKKAAMGAKMVEDQLIQLSDFSNPPQAQYGTIASPYSTSIRGTGINPSLFWWYDQRGDGQIHRSISSSYQNEAQKSASITEEGDDRCDE